MTVHHEDSLRLHPLWESIFLQIGNVPFTIAPERNNEPLTKDWANVGVSTHDRSASFHAGSSRNPNHIAVDSGLIDALWCMANACYAFQTVYEAQKSAKDLTKIPLVLETTDPVAAMGLSFFDTAIRLLTGGGPLDWNALPKISSDQRKGAQQLTLAALGFVMYHEFAHIMGRHTAVPDKAPDDDLATSREQESEADNFALDHILLGVNATDRVGQNTLGFRSWGVITATLVMTAREFSNNTAVELTPGAKVATIEKRTHQLAYTRLDRLLKCQSVISTPIVEQTMYTAACIPLYVQAVQNGIASELHKQVFHDMAALYEHLSDSLHEQLRKLSTGQ